MNDYIQFEGDSYPCFQAEGNAAQFIIPFAKHLLSGQGYDIGCGKAEWSLPGSIIIDPAIDPSYHAMKLPNLGEVDYIFSSHCLEHLDNYIKAIEYWLTVLKVDGRLLLYLPDYSQKYWRPWNNKKHIHVLNPVVITDCLKSHGCKYVTHTGVDLNNSFAVFACK